MATEKKPTAEEIEELTEALAYTYYGRRPVYRNGKFINHLGGYQTLAQARETKKQVDASRAEKPVASKFAVGDKVTLLANKAEGWSREDAVVTEVESKAGMYIVELEEVTEPGDDGYREVSEEQITARK